MAPVIHQNTPRAVPPLHGRNETTFGDWRDVTDAQAYIVEAWSQGFLFGALLIMSVITVSNMRKKVLLHKMILLELLLAMAHGTFCFMEFKGYGWYLSSTAALLYCSYFTHNVVAWMKIKPFFTEPQASFSAKKCRWVTYAFLGTLALSIPVLVFQIYNNFRYFNNINRLYEDVRPYESIARDPWWIFSCLTFFHIMRKNYSLKTLKLIRKSPRFGILLVAMALAIIFTIVDIASSLVPGLSVTDGINPYWKLALVFKCLTDNIMLDDFQSVLKRLGAVKLDGTVGASAHNMDKLSYRSGKSSAQHDFEQSPLADEGHLTRNPSEWFGRESFSDRCLEDNESSTDGHSRRKYSMASSAVGRMGVAIHKLDSLPSLSDLEGSRLLSPEAQCHSASSSRYCNNSIRPSQDDGERSKSLRSEMVDDERRLFSAD